MTTNPERLWVCGWERGGRMRWYVVDERERFDVVDIPASPQEYIRADVAAAAVANASGYETAMAEANRAPGLEDEVAALRAEVEALREWKARAIDELRRCEAWLVKRGASYEEHAGKAASEEIRMLWEQSVAVNRESICKVDAMRGALCCKDDDKAALAAKGVG